MPVSTLTVSVKKTFSLLLFFFILIGISQQTIADEAPIEHSLEDVWKTLSNKNYNKKTEAIKAIARQNPPEALPAMKAMLEGQLYYAKRGKALYFLKEMENNYEFTPLFDNDPARKPVLQENKRGFKKVKVNNRLRTTIRQLLAVIQLTHEDADIRLSAAQELLKNPDAEAAELMKTVIKKETDDRVITTMQTLLAVIQLENGDEAAQLLAINTLADSLTSAAMNALRAYEAPTKALEKKAQSAIKGLSNNKLMVSPIRAA